MAHQSNRGKHLSLSREVERNVEKLDVKKGVKKVIIGVSKGGRHSHKVGTLRVQRVEEGRPVIHVAAYGDNGITNLTVLCHNLADVQPVIQFIASLAE